MSFVIKDQNEILVDIVTWITINSSGITDFSPGSIIRSYCEAVGFCLDDVYVSTYLAFSDYLNSMKTDIFNFNKKTGTVASTNVIFSRSGVSGTVTIPIGTRIATGTDLIFLTNAVATISPGNTNSNSIEVLSEKVGKVYNVSNGTIIVFKDNIDGADSVTNANTATGGTDVESDYDYQERFQSYIEGLGRCNYAGIKYAALTIDGITSVSVRELFPPVANVNAYVYIDDGTVTGCSVAKVAETQLVINGDGTETYPGYRAVGVNIIVDTPDIVPIDVTVDIICINGLDIAAAITEVETAVTNYINHLGVGEDVVKNELIAAVMGVYGITDCSVSVPAGNTTIGVDETARIDVVTISVV